MSNLRVAARASGHCIRCGIKPAFGKIVWHYRSAVGRRIKGTRVPVCEYCTADLERLFGSIPDWLEAKARRETVQVFNARKACEQIVIKEKP